MISRNTNATGRKATYPSMNRMISRDQRAVVIRCTATKAQPADDSPVKNSQFACQACQTRSGATNRPMMNVSAPIAKRTIALAYTDRAIGRLVSAMACSRVNTGSG